MTAEDVQPIRRVGPGGHVKVASGGRGAAWGDLLPGVALAPSRMDQIFKERQVVCVGLLAGLLKIRLETLLDLSTSSKSLFLSSVW